MGVSTEHIRHNKANATLLEGARRLGWNARAVPQNTGGKEHYCGYCTYGCGACEKQGPAVSFLPDAARSGATFVEGFEVRRVLFEKTKNGRGRKAVGVQGVWTSKDAHGGVADESSRITRNVTIRSRAVIVSAGTLQSPLLLLRSGIRNRNVGRNLHLHPVSLLAATYDEETRPWEGGIITSLVTEFENLDGHGYGAKLEPCVMLPGSWLAVLPWGVPLGIKTLDKASSAIAADQSSIENVDQAGHPPSPSCSTAYKLAAVRMRNTVSYISLTRDRGLRARISGAVRGREIQQSAAYKVHPDRIRPQTHARRHHRASKDSVCSRRARNLHGCARCTRAVCEKGEVSCKHVSVYITFFNFEPVIHFNRHRRSTFITIHTVSLTLDEHSDFIFCRQHYT